MSSFLKKIKNNINDSQVGNYITKEELENYKIKILELKDLISDSAKKKQFSLMKKYSLELFSITKTLKSYQRKLKKEEKGG